MASFEGFKAPLCPAGVRRGSAAAGPPDPASGHDYCKSPQTATMPSRDWELDLVSRANVGGARCGRRQRSPLVHESRDAARELEHGIVRSQSRPLTAARPSASGVEQETAATRAPHLSDVSATYKDRWSGPQSSLSRLLRHPREDMGWRHSIAGATRRPIAISYLFI
ncbi:hypothetical protein RR46_00943 [Papilio xuthus]|uniref:Uncharacterized protein n=1 Tax=Papilio xuthus TaxID=66420 RepID=A0A0N1IA32_PAPXU|nr:hypothetical protein RR46_00943 [Papilio xuthus]